MNLNGFESVRRSWMRRRRAAALATAAAIVIVQAGTAFGQGSASAPTSQAAPKATAQTHPQNPELWDVEQMMEEAVQQIARRYNLNKAQENFTRLLLVGRVRAFLDQHETEVRELLRESIDLRLHPEKGTPEVYKRWAERAEPVYEAAKEAILSGNREWGEILNEEQKKLHDSDLAQMNANFTQVGQVMADWKAGKGPGVAGGGQSGAGVSTNPPHGEPRAVEDYWLAYVVTFIQAYNLDEKQANAAKGKVHADFHGQAKVYRERHKAEFDRFDAELKSPAGDPKKQIRPDELLRKKAELERPLRQMFVAMNERLNELLRSDQRVVTDPEKKRQLDMWYSQLAGEFATSQPASRPTTQPATAPTTMPTRPSTPSTGAPAPPATQPNEPPAPAGKAGEALRVDKPPAPPAATTKPATTEPAEKK